MKKTKKSKINKKTNKNYNLNIKLKNKNKIIKNSKIKK